MEFDLSKLFLILSLACGLFTEAAAASALRREASKPLSPEVSQSSKQFFKKDYPFDKRPKADPFHFQHPYPVVQDGDDFDKDFVKDENSDNGSWKAQETYDRLRTKLAREKRDLAKALTRKQMEERELQDATRRHASEAKKRAEAAKKADAVRRRHEEEDKHDEVEEKGEKDSGKAERQPKVQKSAGAAGKSSGDGVKDVEVSTKETEKSMENLEACKKQLAEARQRLKDLMKELEVAKASQSQANGHLDSALKKELTEREHHAALKKSVKAEHDEYMAARDAYLKQQNLVGKLENDIKVAAAKVKAMRDSADADGGVYPTPDEPRSGAPASNRWLWALPMAMMAVCATSA